MFSAVCVAVVFAIQPPARLNRAVVLGLAGLVAWGAVRAGVSPEALALAAACLLVLMAAATAAGGSHQAGFVDAIAIAWLLAAALSTALALCQYFGVDDVLAPWVSPSAAGEAFANLRQRNQFASLTVIGMASLFWLAPGKLGFWPAAAAMAWLAAGNAATTSRAGLAQMVLLALFACASPVLRKQRLRLWLAGFVAYGIAALALPWLLELANGITASRLWERVASVGTCSSRTVLWSNVLHLIAAKPWLGWGWGELDYAHYATLYPGTRFCDILDNAHNLPLHLAVELGIPFALLVGGVLAWVVAQAKPWREMEPARQLAWAVLAVIGVHSLVEYPLWYGPFQIAFGLCLGLLWPSRRAGGAGVAWAMAIAMLAACVYAAWDYRRVSQIYLPPESRAKDFRVDPLPRIRGSWLFGRQAHFAELSITPLTRDNAAWSYDSAQALLHYSPEPRVIERLIESALLLGREDVVLHHLARYRAAFPEAHEAWSRNWTGPAAPAMAR